MKMKKFKIIDSNDNYTKWTNGLSYEKQKELYEQDILIIPENGEKVSQYHDDVIDFLNYVDEQDVQLDYGCCSENEEYVSLNDADIWLGAFATTLVQNPIFINILSNYLYDCFLRFGRNPNVKLSLNVVESKDKQSKTLKFEGDAKTFREIAPEIVKGFNDAFKK